MTDTELATLREALADPIDVLAVYGRDDGHRDWLTSGCWVKPGEVIAHCSAELPDQIQRLLGALEAEQYNTKRLDEALMRASEQLGQWARAMRQTLGELEATQKDAERLRSVLLAAHGRLMLENPHAFADDIVAALKESK